jgi:hypothetical protein
MLSMRRLLHNGKAISKMVMMMLMLMLSCTAFFNTVCKENYEQVHASNARCPQLTMEGRLCSTTRFSKAVQHLVLWRPLEDKGNIPAAAIIASFFLRRPLGGTKHIATHYIVPIAIVIPNPENDHIPHSGNATSSLGPNRE